MDSERTSLSPSPLRNFKSDEAYLISEFIHGAFSYASDHAVTLKKTFETNFHEVLNAVAESETNENMMSNSDLFYLIETY